MKHFPPCCSKTNSRKKTSTDMSFSELWRTLLFLTLLPLVIIIHFSRKKSKNVILTAKNKVMTTWRLCMPMACIQCNVKNAERDTECPKTQFSFYMRFFFLFVKVICNQLVYKCERVWRWWDLFTFPFFGLEPSLLIIIFIPALLLDRDSIH